MRRIRHGGWLIGWWERTLRNIERVVVALWTIEIRATVLSQPWRMERFEVRWLCLLLLVLLPIFRWKQVGSWIEGVMTQTVSLAVPSGRLLRVRFAPHLPGRKFAIAFGIDFSGRRT